MVKICEIRCQSAKTCNQEFRKGR